MKQVFQAEDGRVFESAKECEDYERSMKVGAHPTFTSTCFRALSSLARESDRGYKVIDAEDDADWQRIGIALADHMGNLRTAYTHVISKGLPTRTKRKTAATP